MQISEADAHTIEDWLEIADGARRQLEIAQVRIAAIIGIDDENEWVADCVGGGSDMEKMLAMTNTTVKINVE